MIQIDVSRLKSTQGDVRAIEMDVNLEPLKADAEVFIFNEPLHLSLKATSIGDAIAVSGQIRANITVACGNCLESFILPLSTDISEAYYNQSQEGVEAGEEWIPYSGDFIDITPEVVRNILLELPMRLVCKEECRGLCPGCGENLNSSRCTCSKENIDPRLAKLKSLLDAKE